MAGEREYILSKESYFVTISLLASKKSNEVIKKGSCLVDSLGYIMSIGSNHGNSNCVMDAINNYTGQDLTIKSTKKYLANSVIYLNHFPEYDECIEMLKYDIKSIKYISDTISDEEKNYIDNNFVIEKVDNNKIIETKDYLEYIKNNINYNNLYQGDDNNTIDIDSYNMFFAILAANRSKDPRTQVGSSLVDNQDNLLSIGYNGTLIGISEDKIPWDSIGEETNDILKIKNPYLLHAEINALTSFNGFNGRLNGSKMFVTLSPCLECYKNIASRLNIKEIIYLNKYKRTAYNQIIDFFQNNIEYSNLQTRLIITQFPEYKIIKLIEICDMIIEDLNNIISKQDSIKTYKKL